MSLFHLTTRTSLILIHLTAFSIGNQVTNIAYGLRDNYQHTPTFNDLLEIKFHSGNDKHSLTTASAQINI